MREWTVVRVKVSSHGHAISEAKMSDLVSMVVLLLGIVKIRGDSLCSPCFRDFMKHCIIVVCILLLRI